MKVIVRTHDIKVIQEERVNKNEVNVSKCTFEFGPEYDDYSNLVKKAIFINDGENKAYEMLINNNECDYPPEVLKQVGYPIIGVYAYQIVDGEKLIRFSPSPSRFLVEDGSYRPEAENSKPITPSEFEQYQQALNDGLSKVDKALEKVSNVDISAEQLEDGASVTITDKNGDDTTVTIHDGKNGKQGPQGVPGYTPQKGIDYFTPSEIKDIETNVKEQVETDLDFDNTINGIESDIQDLQTKQTKQGTQIDKNKTDIANINTNLVNYTLISETGSKITLTIDNKTYQMYATLMDKNNNVVNTSNVIDLPIEQLVMSVAYDNTTKEIVIELQNGEITRVPVGALISGLVSETQLEKTLEDYVKNTDYATNSKSGVIIATTYYNTETASSGALRSIVNTFSEYGNLDTKSFISKGTLENVIEGKDLTTKAYADELVGDIGTILDNINGEVIGG